MYEYIYNKSNVTASRLQCEIETNEYIETILVYVLWNLPGDLRIMFEEEITEEEQIVLDDIVSAHPYDSIEECVGLDDDATGSGSVSGIDHSELGALDADDHLQYILVDGTRGFTDTVSGVNPIEDYHLTTRWYVDDTINTAIGTFTGCEFETSSETESTTTSTSWQRKLRLALSDLEAGKYRIDWYYEWAYDNGNFQFKSRVQIDDTDTYMEQEVRPTPASTDKYRDATGFAYMNLTSGDHDVDLDYCSSKNGKTSYIRRARISARRIA
jgi:hypothetical protein